MFSWKSRDLDDIVKLSTTTLDDVLKDEEMQKILPSDLSAVLEKFIEKHLHALCSICVTEVSDDTASAEPHRATTYPKNAVALISALVRENALKVPVVFKTLFSCLAEQRAGLHRVAAMNATGIIWLGLKTYPGSAREGLNELLDDDELFYTFERQMTENSSFSTLFLALIGVAQDPDIPDRTVSDQLADQFVDMFIAKQFPERFIKFSRVAMAKVAAVNYFTIWTDVLNNSAKPSTERFVEALLTAANVKCLVREIIGAIKQSIEAEVAAVAAANEAALLLPASSCSDVVFTSHESSMTAPSQVGGNDNVAAPKAAAFKDPFAGLDATAGAAAPPSPSRQGPKSPSAASGPQPFYPHVAQGLNILAQIATIVKKAHFTTKPGPQEREETVTGHNEIGECLLGCLPDIISLVFPEDEALRAAVRAATTNDAASRSGPSSNAMLRGLHRTALQYLQAVYTFRRKDVLQLLIDRNVFRNLFDWAERDPNHFALVSFIDIILSDTVDDVPLLVDHFVRGPTDCNVLLRLRRWVLQPEPFKHSHLRKICVQLLPLTSALFNAADEELDDHPDPIAKKGWEDSQTPPVAIAAAVAGGGTRGGMLGTMRAGTPSSSSGSSDSDSDSDDDSDEGGDGRSFPTLSQFFNDKKRVFWKAAFKQGKRGHSFPAARFKNMQAYIGRPVVHLPQSTAAQESKLISLDDDIMFNPSSPTSPTVGGFPSSGGGGGESTKKSSRYQIASAANGGTDAEPASGEGEHRGLAVVDAPTGKKTGFYDADDEEEEEVTQLFPFVEIVKKGTNGAATTKPAAATEDEDVTTMFPFSGVKASDPSLAAVEAATPVGAVEEKGAELQDDWDTVDLRPKSDAVPAATAAPAGMDDWNNIDLRPKTDAVPVTSTTAPTATVTTTASDALLADDWDNIDFRPKITEDAAAPAPTATAAPTANSDHRYKLPDLDDDF